MGGDDTRDARGIPWCRGRCHIPAERQRPWESRGRAVGELWIGRQPGKQEPAAEAKPLRAPHLEVPLTVLHHSPEAAAVVGSWTSPPPSAPAIRAPMLPRLMNKRRAEIKCPVPGWDGDGAGGAETIPAPQWVCFCGAKMH